MNKQIKTLQAASIINDLPTLPFVRILNVLDMRHKDLAELPQAQINLVNVKSAMVERVLVRFTDITINKSNDQFAALTLLAAWIKRLVDNLNAPMVAAGQEPIYMPTVPNTQMQNPWQSNTYMLPSQPSWLADWHQGPDSWNPGPSFREHGRHFPVGPCDDSGTLFSVSCSGAARAAHSLLRDIIAANSASLPGLSITYTKKKEGKSACIAGNLGHGVTFTATAVPDDEKEMGYVASLEQIKQSGNMAGYLFVNDRKYLYTATHQYGFSDESRSLLTQEAISNAFKYLWIAYHEEMGSTAAPFHFFAR